MVHIVVKSIKVKQVAIAMSSWGRAKLCLEESLEEATDCFFTW